MKLRNVILALTVGLFFESAMAQADDYLHVRTSQGWEILNLSNIDKLTFRDGTMKALDGKDNVVASFPQESLKEMNVNQSAGVESVAKDNEATFCLSCDEVEMLADGEFKVYDINGSLLVGIDYVKKGEKISLGALVNGVYILSSGKFALKYSKQ